MNAIENILAKLLGEPTGTFPITNELHCQEVKINMQVLNLVQNFLSQMLKIVKVAKQAKLAIPSHSELLWWEKIGIVVNSVKLAITSHSELLRWEKIGKVANLVKLAIPSHSEPLW